MSSESKNHPVCGWAFIAISTLFLAYAIWWMLGNRNSPIDQTAEGIAIQSETLPDSLMDLDRAATVPVVLRVKLLEFGDGSKYLWPTVEVLDILKNETTERFEGRLKLAHLSFGYGIPQGQSTIYLVRIGEWHWRLDEDGNPIQSGFTHASDIR